MVTLIGEESLTCKSTAWLKFIELFDNFGQSPAFLSFHSWRKSKNWCWAIWCHLVDTLNGQHSNFTSFFRYQWSDPPLTQRAIYCPVDCEWWKPCKATVYSCEEICMEVSLQNKWRYCIDSCNEQLSLYFLHVVLQGDILMWNWNIWGKALKWPHFVVNVEMWHVCMTE